MQSPHSAKLPPASGPAFPTQASPALSYLPSSGLPLSPEQTPHGPWLLLGPQCLVQKALKDQRRASFTLGLSPHSGLPEDF